MKSQKTFRIIFVLFFISLFGTVFSQGSVFDQSNSAIEKRLKKDIYLLASDSLQGRESGTASEIMARDYIVSNYKEIGIPPAFKDGSYIQPFTFKATPQYGDSNVLIINKKIFKVEQDFYPLAYSSSAAVSAPLVNVGYGIVVPEDNYNDYKNVEDLKGKIFVIETALPKKHKSDSLFLKYDNLQKKIDTAFAKGAAGIIFINTDKTVENPSSAIGNRVIPASIPIIFVNKKTSKSIGNHSKNPAYVKVDIVRLVKTAYNIAVYIDNKAPKTVIIGGHYDHIGWGKENSMYHGDKLMIHNGADDNASGASAVMELARYFKNVGKKKNNYLFINFSGEEEGLLGSSFFTKSNAFDLSKVNYMLNLDMVGRYDSSKVGLDIIGTGTSSLWDTLIGMTSHPGLKIEKTRSGVDGSDQLSFYVKDIPILFFFTGMHPDYHKPTDDPDKINYAGEATIIKYAEKIIEKADSMGKIPFSKTIDASSMKRTSLKVTLGVVPDHSFDGKGMRIEAVLDDRPAIKAGLLSGDIVIKIGEHEVTEIMSYMKGLSFYKKGDKAIITVKRGEQILTKEVQF